MSKRESQRETGVKGYEPMLRSRKSSAALRFQTYFAPSPCRSIASRFILFLLPTYNAIPLFFIFDALRVPKLQLLKSFSPPCYSRALIL